MRRSGWLRVLAILMVTGLIAAGCGDDDEGGEGTTTTTEAGGGDQGGEALKIGSIRPESGTLAFLGPPEVEGFNVAIEDINAAGGVLGNDVETDTGDEAADEARAREAAQRLVSDGADAIVGAASTAMTQAFIQFLSDEQIVQCSPANTAPGVNDQENADYYFRTAPPDSAVAPVITDRVIADGAQSVAIAHLADDYGNPLAELIETSLTESGAEVVANVGYAPDATTFDTEVQQLTSEDPDAVVLISFAEGAALIRGLLEAGMTTDQLYGGDGLFGPTLVEEVSESDPNIIDGMTVIGASGGEEFNERIAEATDNNFIYGGQTYDCTVIIALAAEAAGSTDPSEFVDEMVPVTKEGTECTTFEECKGLLEDGEDIDYQGASGAVDFTDAGDPTQTRYNIAQFTEGTLEVVETVDVDVAEASGG
jgi:ABC-type branched-subunit amino acid transport system substrate-binding protein